MCFSCLFLYLFITFYYFSTCTRDFVQLVKFIELYELTFKIIDVDRKNGVIHATVQKGYTGN